MPHMATSVALAPRKSNMMERLRRLRNPSTAPPTATAPPGQVDVATQHSTDTAMDSKAPRSSKPRTRHREVALDLEVLNSKLQQYAQTRSQDEEDEPSHVEGGSAKEDVQVPGQLVEETKVSVVEGQTEDRESGEGADSPVDRGGSGATSQQRQSSQDGASICPSIVIHPPEEQQPAAQEPSDFELFLQQAEDDERIRKDKGLPVSPKPKQEPSLNPFYSINLTSPTSVPPKLAEIKETTDDDESLAGSGDGLSSQHTSSSASSGSHDFAATDTQPTRANTASLGRHVSFCEPKKLRARSDSHGSAYHARGFESPQAQRSVTKRRSFRKMVKDCVRRL